jgi:hypothetical protein
MATVQEQSGMREAAWRLVRFLGPAYFIDARSAQHLDHDFDREQGARPVGQGIGARRDAWRHDGRCNRRQAPSRGVTA